MDEIREKTAALAHSQWSGWMDHLFGLCVLNEYGQATIPAGLVSRWKRRAETPYENLSEKERDSDRREADKFIALLRGK